MPLAPGEVVLDRYIIEDVVGVGGMGAVYRARHQKLGMPVAIKTITGTTSPDLVARFTREAMLLAQVRHPHVVSILDVGQCADGSPCMVMEFLEGEALDARLERRGALPWPEVRAIAAAILKGLDTMHGAGIIHRDLKPANILVTRTNPEVVKLVDFGIAHSTSAQAERYTQAGAMIGTPAYMSPEQMVGGVLDARSDLYALALVLYELATGHLPFGDDPNAALRRMREPIPAVSAPAPLPQIPAHATAALMSALAVEVNQRPRSARALYALLKGTPASQAVAPAPATAPQRPPAAPPAVPRTQVKPPAPPPGATQVARGAQAHHGAQTALPPESAGYDISAHANPEALAPQVPAAPVAQSARALVATRLPASRMSREEQKALAQLAAPGRAYHLGGGIWFAIVPGANTEVTKQAARKLGAALQDRFGDSCKVVWTQASSNFALTPASLSGAAPLPEEVSSLLEHLL